jgi:hypothetical protein
VCNQPRRMATIGVRGVKSNGYGAVSVDHPHGPDRTEIAPYSRFQSLIRKSTDAAPL